MGEGERNLLSDHHHWTSPPTRKKGQGWNLEWKDHAPFEVVVVGGCEASCGYQGVELLGKPWHLDDWASWWVVKPQEGA
jgi:hypothetical protein